MKRAFVITLIIQTALTTAFMKTGLSSDGFLEVGFPFIFYKRTNGKAFNPEELGFSYKAFTIDLVFLVIMALAINALTRLTTRPKQPQNRFDEA